MVTKTQAETRCRDYLHHLYEVFTFLATYERVPIDVPEVHHSCAANASKLSAVRKVSKGFPGFGVSISPNWEIPTAPCPVLGVNGSATLIVGGEISVNRGPTLRQSIVIALLLEAQEHIGKVNNKQAEPLEEGERVLIRRFHFDYDTALASPGYPRSHLQYGGKFSGHVPAGAAYRLYSLDLPRIPCPPFDLVLALDFFLRQFPTSLRDMVDESRWLKLVRESERLWLRGYFQEVAQHLDASDRSLTFYGRLSEHVDWPT
jgi:hypothetical protein